MKGRRFGEQIGAKMQPFLTSGTTASSFFTKGELMWLGEHKSPWDTSCG